MDKEESIKNLQTLTNIGKITAEKLYSLGIRNKKCKPRNSL